MPKAKSDKNWKPKFAARHIIIEDSTLVDRVYYDSTNEILDAVFKKGTRYRYYGVSTKVFADFVLAKSLGEFFNEKIRPRAHYEKVE
jgi:hypothetical protein